MNVSESSQEAPGTGPTPALSVVVPVYNEAENIEPLIGEIRAALAAGPAFEIVYVDDGSSDATPQILADTAARVPELRVIRHRSCGGQSAALASGIAAARGDLIATLDGDGQNDPADIPKLVAEHGKAADAARLMVCGLRAKRRDTGIRRISSKVANGVRLRMLGDRTPDTGCGLKVFGRALFLDLPHFNHMHRFMPALTVRGGGRVISVPVNHRPRERGQSKYGLFDRLWVGIVDLFGVMWLQKRALKQDVEPGGAAR